MQYFSDILEIFPPMPQNYEVPESYLSPHMQKIRDDLKITKEGQKLICDLGAKKNYVISAYTLKTYLRAGVKITGNYNKIKLNTLVTSIFESTDTIFESVKSISESVESIFEMSHCHHRRTLPPIDSTFTIFPTHIYNFSYQTWNCLPSSSHH